MPFFVYNKSVKQDTDIIIVRDTHEKKIGVVRSAMMNNNTIYLTRRVMILTLPELVGWRYCEGRGVCC